MHKPKVDQGTARTARMVRAVVASVCVMGLVGMMWLPGERSQLHLGESVEALSNVVPESGSAVFLHASAKDGSVPSADQVFNARGQVPAGDEAVAPTF